MRSFRDSFYDKSDIFIALIIIAAAAVVIGLRINAIMDYPETVADADKQVQTQTEQPADTSASDKDKTSTEASDKDKDTKTSDSSDNEDSSKDSDKDKKDSGKLDDKDKKDSDKSSSEYVTIKITDLDSSADITAMLKKKGLISSASKFEQTLKDHKLTTKLKSGTFKIKKGASTKDIIKKLTGESI